MIDILIPVLNRPQNAAAVATSIRESSTVDVNILFLCSPGDDAQIEACAQTDAYVLIVDWPPGPGDYARKINEGFRAHTGEWVFTAADDLLFHPGWDTALMEAAQDGAAVIGTNDMGNPLVMKGGHSTHTLVRRAYVDDVGATYLDGPGVVLHEGYDHQWIDTELVGAAQARQVWAFAANSRVEHLHPMWHKSEMDATYRKALAESKHDRHLFRKRTREFNQFRRRGRIR